MLKLISSIFPSHGGPDNPNPDGGPDSSGDPGSSGYNGDKSSDPDNEVRVHSCVCCM